MKLGITPKMHVSSFCPIVWPGTATRPSPQLSTLPLTPAPWPLCGPVPLPPHRELGAYFPEGMGTRHKLAGSQNSRGLPPSLQNAPCPLSAAREGRNVLSSGKCHPGLAATKGWGVARTLPEPFSWEGRKEWGC